MNTDHVVVDYSTKPNKHLCKNCGVSKDIVFPIKLEDFVKESKQFIKEHKKCKETKDADN